MGFSDIIGHKEIIRALDAAVNESKVSHAYLFIGPAGIGKKTLAKAFAARLLCLESTAAGDCRCPACSRLATNSHPDLVTVLPAGNSIKIEQLRHLQRDLFYRPLVGDRKVYFFPDAEQLTEVAANSFLKTLEEPPPGVVFLFTAVRQDLILPTIRSRCQVYQLFPVPWDEIAEALIKKGVDRSEALERAKLSQGIPGRALSDLAGEQNEAGFALKEILSLNLLDLFKLANDFEKKERSEMLAIFKKWELQARRELLQASAVDLDPQQLNKSILILEKIGQAKNMVESNVNLRLVLEEFFTTMKTAVLLDAEGHSLKG